MNAIQLLKQQHKEALRLLREVKECDDVSEKESLWNECADTLALHFLLEEQSFYPELKNDQTEEQLLEAVEEHLAAKRVLADMLDLDVDDDVFDAKLTVLTEEVRHHVNEEEQHMFPDFERIFGPKKFESLGEELEGAVEELQNQGHPKDVIPSQTDAAPPI